MVERKWMVLSNTSLALLMTSIDSSSVIIALPTIGRELSNTSALDIVWMVIGYQLVLGSVLVNIGRFADLFGRARLYKFGYLALTVGSLLCSLSQSGGELVLFRFMQGGGAALIQANTTAIVMDTFGPGERGKALGINTIALSSGMILGLVVGGTLTSFLGWQSIFWINVPVGLFSLLWSHLHLKEMRKVPGKVKIDIPGNVTFLVALTSALAATTLYSLDLLGEAGFAGLLLLSVASFILFVYAELRSKAPMVSLKLFKIRPFAVGNAVQFINGIGRGTLQLVLTFYLQGPTMQLSAALASFYLLPNALTMIVMSPLSGTLSDRFGPRVFTLLGTAIGGVGFLMLAQLGPVSSYWQFALPLVINGIGGGMFQTPNRVQVVGSVDPQQRGVATGVYMTFINVGGVLSRGVTFLVMGLVIPGATLSAVFAGQYDKVPNQGAFSAEFISGLHAVFYFGAVLTAVAMLLCFLWFMGYIKDTTAEEEPVVGPAPPAGQPDRTTEAGRGDRTGNSRGAGPSDRPSGVPRDDSETVRPRDRSRGAQRWARP